MAVKRKKRWSRGPDRQTVAHSGLYPYLQRYHEAMAIQQYSQVTLQRRDSHLRRFIVWCDERGIHDPRVITKPMLEGYQRSLFYTRQPNGQPLSARTQSLYLMGLKQWFKWLTQQNYLVSNPASEVALPKFRKALPEVLSVSEVQRLLAQPDTGTPEGVRDRAILEVLYSTGMRRKELCGLRVQDWSRARQTVMIREGKGQQDRVVPLGTQAQQWLARYVETVRYQYLMELHTPWLFLNDYGDGFNVSQLGWRVKQHLSGAGIHLPGSCHLLRHAMATHMLENGAETRYIQAMLGHKRLETTQIYTHVSVRRLQEVHAATHPREREREQPDSHDTD